MKIIRNTFIIIISALLFSCSDYLDIMPDNVATIEHAFADRVSAERFLATIYSYMPRIGDMAEDPAILASDEYGVIEDDYYINALGYVGNRIKLGEQNVNGPLMDYWNGANRGRGLFVAIRDCNIFLENIHNVGQDLSDQERERWIAEVKFFKAFYHYYLLRMYGPIPLIKENKSVAAGVEEIKVYREPVDDCVDYIVQLCDEAMPDLPVTIANISIELGRITRPIAATLKAEVLVLGASPLFNGNTEYSTFTDNKGTKLFSDKEDPAKWSRAATACKEAIDICHEAGIKLYEYADNFLSDETRRGVSIRGAATTKWNEELIWGNPVDTTIELQKRALPRLKTEDKAGNPWGGEVYATFNVAEQFYSNNGVPINEDIHYNYSGRYDLVTVADDHYYYIKEGFTTAVLNTYREPRFYASLGFDGGYWFGNGRTKDIGTGNDSEISWLMNAKSGETSGKASNIRYSRSGYFVKKSVNTETATSTAGVITVNRYTYPIMRLADLYLLYAEALNESMDTPGDEIYGYLDLVRERAGLKGVVESWREYSSLPDKPLNKTGLREIIRQERMIELCFESKRFWDIRRWKLAHNNFNQPERGWNVTQSTTEDYYQVITFNQLLFSTRQYFWPIKESELRRNINLVQNPYWD